MEERVNNFICKNIDEGRQVYVVCPLVEEKEEVEDIENPVSTDGLQGNIKFEHVNFGYDEQKIILDNINFKINAGEMIGFVGKSGARKNNNIQFVM